MYLLSSWALGEKIAPTPSLITVNVRLQLAVG